MATSQAVDLLLTATIYKTFYTVPSAQRTRSEIGPSSDKSHSKSCPLLPTEIVFESVAFRWASVDICPTQGKCFILLHTNFDCLMTLI